MWNDRTVKLIGDEGYKKLKSSKVVVVGLGGVGGYVAVLLARAGIQNLTLIDFDKVDETNINRQIVATLLTVGRFKTEVISEIISGINRDANITIKTERLTSENIETLIPKDSDYVIDCIDSVMDKLELCTYATLNNLKIISAMGAGNRIDIPEFEVMDIYKTSGDGLAKVMRKGLRERGVKKLTVVCPKSLPISNVQGVGSISYYPCMCGCVLAAKVINDILGG